MKVTYSKYLYDINYVLIKKHNSYDKGSNTEIKARTGQVYLN